MTALIRLKVAIQLAWKVFRWALSPYAADPCQRTAIAYGAKMEQGDDLYTIDVRGRFRSGWPEHRKALDVDIAEIA